MKSFRINGASPLANGIVAVACLAAFGCGQSASLVGHHDAHGVTERELRAPENLAVGGGIRQVVVGFKHACALLKGGQVTCWGDNDFGQLDVNSVRSPARPVAGLPMNFGGAIQIAAGREHTCAVLKNKTVRCWGSNRGVENDKGQRGAAVGENVALHDVEEVAVSDSSTCVRLTDGKISCWGSNKLGELGNGKADIFDSPHPVPSAPFELGEGRKATSIVGGGRHFCAVIERGGFTCWGNNQDGQIGINSPDPAVLKPGALVAIGEPVVQGALGGRHTCVLLESGAVKCWGANDRGQAGRLAIALADGTDKKFGTPKKRIKFGDDAATRITAGSGHNCALVTDGEGKAGARCWGSNVGGLLGDPSSKNLEGSWQPAPAGRVDFGRGRSPVSLSAGAFSTCALLDNDTIKCWGGDGSGQLGTGTVGGWIGKKADDMGDNLIPVQFTEL